MPEEESPAPDSLKKSKSDLFGNEVKPVFWSDAWKAGAVIDPKQKDSFRDSLIVNFRTREGKEEFLKLIAGRVTSSNTDLNKITDLSGEWDQTELTSKLAGRIQLVSQPRKDLFGEDRLVEVSDGRTTKLKLKPWWADIWDETMPEFCQDNTMPHSTATFRFERHDDLVMFVKMISGKEYVRTAGKQKASIWFPHYERAAVQVREYQKVPKNKYPVYIISKGRWESRLTSKALERLHIPYKIVVEPQEFDNYAAVISPKKILTLPFSNLGRGSIPARNWVWEHSIKAGAERHWILDDNIRGFYRLNHNHRSWIVDENPFSACEDLSNRYSNVGMSGLNYGYLVVERSPDLPPLYLNTRIYSCILLSNSVKHRWRGRYNEDTDLSLCILKDGMCTILLNAYLAIKVTTLTMKGGNMESLYQGDGRLKMAESLRDQHPDVVRVVRKWGRWQHSVDYRPFKKNKLIPISK